MANKTVRVQPIQGKFAMVTSNGKIIRIWLVDPRTNKQGTEVSYNDAIELLALRNPVICLSQEKGPDGKYIQQLDEKDWEIIKKKHEENVNRIASNTLQETVVEKTDNSALEKLVETQTKLIDAQNKQLEEMTKNFAALMKDVEKLKKKNKIKDEKTE